MIKYPEGDITMQFTQINNLIRIDFQYDPAVVASVKLLPGAKFEKDVTGAYWTIPKENLEYILEKFPLSPGSLYPGCKDLLNPDYYGDLKVCIKEDRVKIEGIKSALMSQSILDLCSFEYLQDKKLFARSIAEEIYAQNKIVVVKFPPGLYWKVLSFVKLFNIDLVIYPYPEAPKHNPVSIKTTPRPYQQEAVNKILSGEIYNRGTLVMATGAGKTILSAMITAAIGVNTIFYTYSSDLLDQTAETYEELFGVKIGRVSGEYFDIQPITIATVQTVYSCRERQDERWRALSEYLDTVNLTFIDEGHMLGAETIFAVSQITNAYYAYSLTATPKREDGKELLIEAGTGPVVNLVSEESLIKGGFVLPVDVYFYKVPHPTYKVRTYNGLYKKHIVDNEFRNQMIADIANGYKSKQTIILVKEIKHGENLTRLLNAPFIHGQSKNRKEVISSFKTKEINLIIASNILKQGIDLPEAEVLILAHGGVGTVELQQKIGRVRRPSPGKEYGIVIDFYDYYANCQNNVFQDQSEKRIAFYKQKGYSAYFMDLDTLAASK